MYGKMNKGYLEYAPNDLKTDDDILLEEYLEGRYYNITSQKQQYLNISIKPENPDPVSWNDRGEECEPWTCNQIFQLAKDVYEYSISYEAEAIEK